MPQTIRGAQDFTPILSRDGTWKILWLLEVMIIDAAEAGRRLDLAAGDVIWLRSVAFDSEKAKNRKAR